MKKITTLFITLLFITTAGQLFAQSEEAKFFYCESVGTQKFLSQKVTINIEFGEEKNYWKDNRVKDEVTGKVQVFNSMVDALNYMGSDQWEFVQAYIVTTGQQNVYHWLLKKRKQE